MFSSARSLVRSLPKLQQAAGMMVRAKHTLPNLPYDYKDLEPVICAEIMQLHHCKHHQAYINNYNAAEEQLEEALNCNDTSKIIALGNVLKFNGGGHLNHSIFWANLSSCQTRYSPELKEAIDEAFCSYENFKKEMIAKTVAVQGSGWGWLGYNKKTKKLEIATCFNQDPLEATTGLVPIFGIDVWEHAYYLQYKNLRPNYVEAIFDIINWDDLNKRYALASC